MVEGTRCLLKDAILSNPGCALQDPMKHPGLLKLRSVQSVPTPSMRGLKYRVVVLKSDSDQDGFKEGKKKGQLPSSLLDALLRTTTAVGPSSSPKKLLTWYSKAPRRGSKQHLVIQSCGRGCRSGPSCCCREAPGAAGPSI